MRSKLKSLLICVAVLGTLLPWHANAEEKPWFDKKVDWRGFNQFHFKLDGVAAYLVEPSKPAAGNPWIWRARFPGYHAEMDIELVKRGFHIAYVDVAGLLGSDEAMRRGDLLWDKMTKRGLAKKPVLEGVSRGGLVVYNWAARHPKNVACIYCDTPVCDIKSWPGGKGSGVGSAPTWKQCLAVYKMTEEEALKYDKNPIDHAGVIAKHKIPILHIVSENDQIVPPKENSYVLQTNLKKHGHDMEIISVVEGTAKSNGHHFTHPDPDRVVDFIDKHGRAWVAQK